MKKFKLGTSIVSLLLIFSMLSALTGCNSESSGRKRTRDAKKENSILQEIEDTRPDTEKILGTWNATVDLGELFAKLSGEAAEGFQFRSAPYTMSITFDAGDDCAVSTDETSFKNAIAIALTDAANANLRDKAPGMTVDEFVIASNAGVSWDVLRDYMAEQAAENRPNETCTWKIEDGKLSLTDKDNTVSAYFYTLSASELTLTDLSEGGDDAIIGKELLPLTFKKQA